MNLSKFFKLWKQNTKRQIWNQLRQEEINEEIYARETGMDPIHWCWNCKYSDCERHQN
jgi:hypothetical protein